MKQVNYYIYTGAVVFMLVVSSCTKGFKDLNKNPNASEFALPQALLAPAITDVVSRNMDRGAKRINNELMQVHVLMGDVEGRIFRYDIRRSEADYLWNNWYLQLTNFKSLYTSAEELYRVDGNNVSKTYMAIGLICQSWVASLLTDTYGDIPYFDANKGKDGILMPVFDRQEDIYKDIFDKLEQANELLKTGADLPAEQAGSDPIYAGAAAKWRKFGNSLYLRLLLRVSAKAESDVAAKVREIVQTQANNYPIIATNAESAILRWTGVLPYQSPFQTDRDSDWNLLKLAEFFVDNLNAWGDPRIVKWATLKNGQYAGIPSGYPVGEVPDPKSAMPLALKTEPLLGNIMNYAEVQFILCEAALRGWISGSAQQYYENGITNGITLWGYNVPANYLAGTFIKWDESEPFDNKLEKIQLQKYYSLFFTDLEQWFEYRRTGHPVLPKGTGLLNNGEMPARLNYPVYLQSTNRDNYDAAVAIQGPDDISTKVWWQRP
ncbi:SusD/RagB family nutrient-binding outer membrane lipoprotein [Pedobacter sp. BS3]|uniref:SusD/RagB family nutrient-binding outer membrane lipoprotein n=1 Tax=Pedobacter sp. BS3 TaxID=2567937 RepID=UPI0011EFC5B9|nr:SusD/RagB family nutrient-binding outer membrane lipoprotein [Pedobacter sp. BS3]TZF81112.1 SusD/RagB family nutrient-binding outer membrane lipoprotein [Pedobacter sp. BS3]